MIQTQIFSDNCLQRLQDNMNEWLKVHTPTINILDTETYQVLVQQPSMFIQTTIIIWYECKMQEGNITEGACDGSDAVSSNPLF